LRHLRLRGVSPNSLWCFLRSRFIFLPLNSEQRTILKWVSGQAPKQLPDRLVVEEPLEIQVETRPISVTMRTPGNDEELAAGFLLTEGLISNRDQIAKIVPYPRNPKGNAINFHLRPDIQIDFAKLTRHVFASSSCGLCGAATIDAVHKTFPPVQAAVSITAKELLELPRKLRKEQGAFDLTGGLHAAGLFTLRGDPIVIREDVGRHNAVDKVLGHALLNHLLPLDSAILVVSGRASFEIMQKALGGRIPIIVAVSAPSSLAVDFAEKSGQTLIAFTRNDRFNVYTHQQRVTFD